MEAYWFFKKCLNLGRWNLKLILHFFQAEAPLSDPDSSWSGATSYLDIDLMEQGGFQIYNQITTLKLCACYANVMTSLVRVYFQGWKLAF